MCRESRVAEANFFLEKKIGEMNEKYIYINLCRKYFHTEQKEIYMCLIRNKLYEKPNFSEIFHLSMENKREQE